MSRSELEGRMSKKDYAMLVSAVLISMAIWSVPNTNAMRKRTVMKFAPAVQVQY